MNIIQSFVGHRTHFLLSPDSVLTTRPPDLVLLSVLSDFDSLDESSVEENTWLGFNVAEREFGISPLMTVEEMLSVAEPDSLSMVMYLSQFYQLLKDTPPPPGETQEETNLT